MDELAFRDARLGWRGIATLAAAGAAIYALVAYGGVPGATLVGGLSVGYLVARTTQF